MQRIQFVHQLRGIAALSVVISHYLGVFWASPKGVSYLLGVPELSEELTQFNLAQWFIDHKLIFGQFGVGIFFIISGFVIPFSISKLSRLSFVVERIFRIYPVYIVGFSITLAGIYLATIYTDNPFPYTFEHILIHYMIVVREWTQFSVIDGVSWTLEVELKFYLYCAIFALIMTKHPRSFLLFSLVLFFLLGWQLFGDKETWRLGRQMIMHQMLMLGVLFNFYYRKLVSLQFSLLYTALSVPLFTFVWLESFLKTQALDWLYGYALGALVFTLLYIFRRHIPNSKLFSHLADISYPMYALHAIFGYALLYIFLHSFTNKFLTITVAFIVVYLISYIVHILVENPSLKLGKRLSSRFNHRLRQNIPETAPNKSF